MKSILYLLLTAVSLWANIVVDDYLQVPYIAAVDSLSKLTTLSTVSRTYMNKYKTDSLATDTDCLPWFKVLYDDNNLYYICQVIDDSVTADDGWEFYLNGWNYSQVDTFDLIDDIHFCINFDANSNDSVWVSPQTLKNEYFKKEEIEFYKVQNETGWVLSLKLTLSSIGIEAEDGWPFGFELQYNDLDKDTTIYRWWSIDPQVTYNPSIWGNAMLSYVGIGSNTIGLFPFLNDSIYQSFQNYPGLNGTWSAEQWYYQNKNQFTHRMDNDFYFTAAWYCKGICVYLTAFDDILYNSGDSLHKSDDHIEIFIIALQDNDEFKISNITLPIEKNYTSPYLNDYKHTLTNNGWIHYASLDYNALGMEDPYGWTFYMNIKKYDNDGDGLKSIASWQDEKTFNLLDRSTWPFLFVMRVFGCSGPPCNPDKVETCKSVEQFLIHPAFPNPFNNSTNIAFDLSAQSNIRIDIINIKGQHVNTILNETRQAGHYTIKWNGTNVHGQSLPSGVYFARLYIETDDQYYSKTLKLVLLK